ncbi:MAG: staphyloferrin synthase, partial [Micromonosporaceae bacterium]|nr:staphyloferrin synthase [Micromonosporaceae bacterium]
MADPSSTSARTPTVEATTGAGWTTEAERATGVELGTSRPELLARYLRALPDARAAVLARLWGALAREPIAGITGRTRDGGDLVVTLTGGRRLRGPAGAAEPFAEVPDGLTLTLGGDPVGHPAALARILDPDRPEHDDPPGHGDRPGRGGRLVAELDNSVANLALARAAQPPPDGGSPMLVRLAGDGPAGGDAVLAEQLVVDGHPLHPGCRTRLGMSPAEVLAYAPEHRRSVDLAVVAVPADRWISTGTGLPPLLLVHPWQRDHILPRYPGMRLTGRTVAARPLMSLRTLAPVDEPGWHVKTAVDVQMTSAVRTVSAAAIHNGPLLSALIERAAAGRLELLAEVAGGAVLVEGQPCRSLAMVRRRAPRVAAGEVVVPFAALAARSAADGRPLVTEAVTLGYPGRPAAL